MLEKSSKEKIIQTLTTAIYEWNKQDNLMDSKIKSIAKYLSLILTKSLEKFKVQSMEYTMYTNSFDSSIIKSMYNQTLFDLNW